MEFIGHAIWDAVRSLALTINRHLPLMALIVYFSAGFLGMAAGAKRFPWERVPGAHWRYRDRGGRLARFHPSMPTFEGPGWAGMTRGWWVTRLEFLVASVAAAIATLAVVWNASIPSHESPSAVSIELAGLVGILVGIGLMVWLYRAPGRVDAAARWRYRDPA